MTQPGQNAGIRVEWMDSILVLTLDQPENLNPISVAVREVWNAELHEIERQAQDCRAVVITGTGRAFTAGGDVSEMPDFFGGGADHAVQHMLRFQEMCRLVYRLPAPVITAVNGIALGGGTAVALLSDLRVASEDAIFGVGQAKRGLVPDVGLTYLLPRMIGIPRAFELMTMGRRIDARTALSWGLVNAVVAADEVMPTALAWARTLAQQSAPAIRWIKRVMYLNLDSSLDQALNLEAMAEGILVGTPEFAQSLDEFLNER